VIAHDAGDVLLSDVHFVITSGGLSGNDEANGVVGVGGDRVAFNEGQRSLWGLGVIKRDFDTLDTRWHLDVSSDSRFRTDDDIGSVKGDMHLAVVNVEGSTVSDAVAAFLKISNTHLVKDICGY
jgi:hypothetical protein